MKSSSACFLVCLPLALMFGGCVSTRKYKLAAADTPAVKPLNFTYAGPAIAATLQTVIVYRGPGSWKREAFWDEYVIAIANRGTVPMTVESAVLTDFRDEPVTAGTDPWALDRASRTWWRDVGSARTTTRLKLGASPALLAAGQALAGTTTAISVMAFALGATATSAAAYVPLAWPVYALSAVSINHSNKKAVAAEFARRQFTLPASISPGEQRNGSFFFRIAPGPKRIALRYTVGDRVDELVIDLAPLASLHLAADPTAAPPR
jgi:hypothetical protein